MTGGLLLDEAQAPAGDIRERAEVEWSYKVEPGYVQDLNVDHSYQRPVEERWVEERVGEFEESLVGSIDVSVRADGTRWIMDGQQRWELSKRVGKTTMWQNVYHGLARKDEAGFFSRKNEPKPMRAFYKFRARMVGGDEEFQAINDAVEAVGYKLGPVSDHQDVIGSMTAIERAWRLDSEHRAECLTPALRTIRSAYLGRKQSLSASVIVGVARFWRAYPDEAVDGGVLSEVLEEIGSPANLQGLARDRMESGWRMPQSVAAVLVEWYNQRQRARVGATRNAATFEGRLDPDAIR